MKNIDILYNPYAKRAGLNVDGVRYGGGEGRLNDFLVGKPMESWLSWRIVSYQRWEGILPELMDFFNDDELMIRFCGLSQDYRKVEEELKKQEITVEEKGFDSRLYRLSFLEQWQPEAIRQNVLRFIRNRVDFVPVQKEMMELEYLGERLEQAGGQGAEVEALIRVKEELKRITEGIIRECGKEEYKKYKKTWENARREAEQIFS